MYNMRESLLVLPWLAAYFENVIYLTKEALESWTHPYPRSIIYSFWFFINIDIRSFRKNNRRLFSCDSKWICELKTTQMFQLSSCVYACDLDL